jgi:very-short-patch-repair endonuclease
MIEQYSVNLYKIDLYFVDYKLAIECDENQHNRETNKDKDKLREENIKKIIEDIYFIRYSPFNKDFNIYKVFNEIFTYIRLKDGVKI